MAEKRIGRVDHHIHDERGEAHNRDLRRDRGGRIQELRQDRREIGLGELREAAALPFPIPIEGDRVARLPTVEAGVDRDRDGVVADYTVGIAPRFPLGVCSLRVGLEFVRRSSLMAEAARENIVFGEPDHGATFAVFVRSGDEQGL